MYRQYEDPRKLEQEYKEKLAKYNELVANNAFEDDTQMYDAYCQLKELEDRVAFAWADEEADMLMED